MGSKKSKKVKHYYSDMRFVQISKSFLYDVRRGSYSTQELFVFTTLKMLSTGTPSPKSEENCVTSIDILLSMMKICVNSRNKKTVAESIERLVEGGLIGVYEDYSYKNKVDEIDFKKVLYIRIEEKIPSGEYFVKLYEEEYAKMTLSDEAVVAKMLNVFLAICGEIYEGKDGFTYLGISEISDATNLDRKTVTKHIQKLEDVQAIKRSLIKGSNKEGAYRSKNAMTRFGWSNRLVNAQL